MFADCVSLVAEWEETAGVGRNCKSGRKLLEWEEMARVGGNCKSGRNLVEWEETGRDL